MMIRVILVLSCAAIDAGADQVEEPVMEGDIGREHAARTAQAAEIKLVGPVDRIADLAPMHHVARPEDR